MSKQLAFRPVIGTNAQILDQTPTAGYVWFATDSKKIYYSDGTSFLSMGGNTGIYYGIKEIPEDTDTEQTDFTFAVTEIDGNAAVTDGNYKIPNKDDLILNIPDGCFYRVNNTVELNGAIQINTTRLTITGGGGAIGPAIGILVIEDVDKNPTKYFTADTTEAKLRFKVSSPSVLEGNGIAKIKYTIGAIATVEDTDYKEFGIVEFDLLPYISRMTTSTYTTITVQVEDVYGVKKSYYYYINVVELALSSGYKNNILMTETGKYNYSCLPTGGSSLSDKEVIISFYDASNNHLDNDIITEVSITNSDLPIEITVPAIGAFTMVVMYRGKLPTGNWVNSNSLTYQIVYYNEEPQLVVNVPTLRVEQYSTMNITYMIAAKTNSVDKIEVKLYKGESESVQAVDYNVLNTWSIYFDTPGFYDLSVEAVGITKTYPNIEVYKYSGKVPAINTSGLTLNLSATNRSNTEVNKDTWVSGDAHCSFENFAWGSVNGWMKDEDGQDMLHLSAGAKLEVLDFFPFDTDPMDRQNGTGQTIELDFKVSGVTDFSAGLIECLSYQDKDTIQTGFQITGQGSTLNTQQIKATHGSISESETDQVYNTQIQGCTAKFIENERIHLTWVIENPTTNDYPMIRTYLNGVLSGLTQYGKEDSMIHNRTNPATIIFDSTRGNIDIYNIRVYKNSPLADNIVLDNYIATYGTIAEKTAKYLDNATVLDDNNKISIEKVEAENINSGYMLSVPYIKIIGGQGLIKDDEGYQLNSGDSDQRLPNAKKDYRLVQKYEFIDMSGKRPNQTLESTFKSNGYLNGIAMYGQGTSSMEYPVKNLRLKAKMKDANDNKIKFPVNDCKVDLVCLKADYMESSGSHNTGTGNLVHTLTKAMGLRTPGQAYWQDESKKANYDVVSAIRGFPILVFFKTPQQANESLEEFEARPYEFIGKYNFNLDKATHEPFGFEYDEDGTFGWTPNNYKFVGKIKEKAYNEYPFTLFVKDGETYTEATAYNSNTEYWTIDNHVHCYEFLNNASNLANFLNDEGETFETTFTKTVLSEGKEVPNWFASYESRYPEYADAASTDIASWLRLCNWINSTKDNPTKFKEEFDDYLDFDFTCFYYILTHVLLMIDSRAKNMMIATWDDRIWYPIFYDMDTMLGLNNYGYNKFHYDVEDTHVNVYNGQASILWNNFRAAFPAEIQQFYQRMQTAGLTYNGLLKNYNENQADAVNEIIYNNDSKYKYIRPFTEEFIDNSGDEPIPVLPGTRDYLYASQGSRSMHRKWWLQNRINYFNGKYLSDAYKKDRYILRLYTPSASGDNYYAVPDLTEEQFILNKTAYYIRSGTEGNYVFTPMKESDSFDSNTTYYMKAPNALKESIEAVPPNNDFTLTPLYNQYLSVAFGGDNGITTNPLYVEANTPRLIAAPAGAVYNDTETYLYGGSMLKDLGDLSYQYLGRFAFPEKGETKLEKLTLGNPNNAYYNPNFSMLTIGTAAPYLKELEISNCSGLSGRGVDVSGCKNIQKIFATGTGISNMTLPAYGVLSELRLPNTISSLTLIEQTQLQANNFTIGSCSYDPTTQTRTYTDESGRIIFLRIENTPIDSYSLVKNNPIQRFYLKDINWTITSINDLNADKTEIVVLEKLLDDTVISAISNQTKAQSLIGTITLKQELGLTTAQAMALYAKYCKATAFPNINFIFEGLDIYDVVILNGNGTTLWSKKIVGNTDGTVDITKDFLSDTTFGIFTLPTKSETIQYTYQFTNQWFVNSEIESNKKDCSDVTPKGWPIIEDIVPDSNGTITLIPSFARDLRQYEISFINPYDQHFTHSVTVDYGTKINTILPTEIPFRDDSGLDYNLTYSHVGYNIQENANYGIEFVDSDIVTGPKTYYAIFKEISVYENIHEDYFTYMKSSYTDPVDTAFNIAEGYSISPKAGLKGKITIPAEYNHLPICQVAANAFLKNANITHIFFAKNNKVRILDEYAFAECPALKYFEFTGALRIIDNHVFYKGAPLAPLDHCYNFGKNLYSLGTFAFNQSLYFTEPVTIILPHTLERLGSYALSNFKQGSAAVTVNVIIGEAGKYSNLDVGAGMTDVGYWPCIRTPQGQVGTVEFYSTLYTDPTQPVTGSYGSTQTHPLQSWLGYDTGAKVIVYNKEGVKQSD